MLSYSRVIFCICSLISSVFGGVANESPHIFYINIGMGSDSLVGRRHDAAINPGPPVVTTDFNTKKSFRVTSMAGEMGGGYLYKFSRYAVGAEANCGYSKLENSVKKDLTFNFNTNEYTVRQVLSQYINANARAGMFVDNYLVSVLAGVHIRQMRWKLDVFWNDGLGTRTFFLSANKYKVVPSIGISVQKSITPQVSVNLELKADFFRKYIQKWDKYFLDSHNIHSSFKNTLYSARLKFVYSL